MISFNEGYIFSMKLRAKGTFLRSKSQPLTLTGCSPKRLQTTTKINKNISNHTNDCHNNKHLKSRGLNWSATAAFCCGFLYKETTWSFANQIEGYKEKPNYSDCVHSVERNKENDCDQVRHLLRSFPALKLPLQIAGFWRSPSHVSFRTVSIDDKYDNILSILSTLRVKR